MMSLAVKPLLFLRVKSNPSIKIMFFAKLKLEDSIDVICSFLDIRVETLDPRLIFCVKESFYFMELFCKFQE